MSMPIYTNKADIEDALTRSKGVVQGLQDSKTELTNMQTELLNTFNGGGAQIYKDVADQLGRRLTSFDESITALDNSTEHAARLIGDADQAVANMFSNLL
ncbi:WXG100 family type VII secretion target [Nocardia rhamnosiphila]